MNHKNVLFSLLFLLLIACGGGEKNNEVRDTAAEVLSGQGRVTLTMQDIKAIGAAIEAYTTDTGAPPVANSLEQLKPLLEPMHIRVIPATDQWGRPFRYQHAESDDVVYSIASAGPDGIFENFQKTGDDIVYQNGQFL